MLELKPLGHAPLTPNGQAYMLGPCSVIVELEPDGWHLSIAHVRRYPTWDEIKEARYRLLPSEKTYVMVFPPPEEYVNQHPNCFHLWELKQEEERQT